MKLSIIVFRSGDLHAADNILTGWVDLPLSSKGENQARELERKLKNERIDVAFCSDLIASKETLAITLANHLKAKVVIDHRLRERNFGAITGFMSADEFKLNLKKALDPHGQYHFDIPNGESLLLVSKRVFPFMSDVLRFMKKEKKSVAICAHEDSIKLVIEYLEGLSPSHAASIAHHPSEYRKYVVEFK
jgi:2,3-bisphosphoglycerate-dependent phosphoglycerate mutase